jgi:glycosyltransferase involved in cell wall biosynthesis
MTKLSVVLPVYNGAARLGATLESIAAQTMGDFELIAVDDGSTDETPALLAAAADSDRRIRVVRQENAGITRALIRGCAEAGAEVIARHDCGDTSAPDRFARQFDALRDGVVLVSCAARYVGPNGEELYVARADGDDVRRSLLHDGVRTIRGLPHHGTAMFRRADYVAAGGYRPEFRFAQDVDLWVRLATRGGIVILQDVLYTATYSADAISATRRGQQIALARIALQLRDETMPDAERARLLARASAVGRAAQPPRRRDQAAALYFLASCLRRNGDPRWRDYARSALRSDPLHLRSRLLLLKP